MAACTGRPTLDVAAAGNGNLVLHIAMPAGTPNLAALKYHVLGEPQLAGSLKIDVTTAGSRRADGTVFIQIKPTKYQPGVRYGLKLAAVTPKPCQGPFSSPLQYVVGLAPLLPR